MINLQRSYFYCKNRTRNALLISIMLHAIALITLRVSFKGVESYLIESDTGYLSVTFSKEATPSIANYPRVLKHPKHRLYNMHVQQPQGSPASPEVRSVNAAMFASSTVCFLKCGVRESLDSSMPQDIRTYSEIELSQGTIKGDALGTLGAFGTGTDAFGAGTEHGSGKGTNIGTGYRAVRGAGIGPTDREEKEKQMKGLTESEYSGLPQKELSTQIDQPFHLPTGKPGTPKLDLVFILPAETKRMYNFDAYIRNFINTYLSRLDKKCSCALGLVEYRTFDTRGHKIRGVTTDPHIFSDWLAEGAQAFREYGLYDGPADAMLLALERITFRKKAKIRFVLFIEASIYNIPILAHQREGSYVTGWYTLDEVVKQLKAANVAVDVAFFNDCKVASFIANTTGGRVWSWISR